MLSLTDTFIQFLATELANEPPVHWVRYVADDNTSGVLQINALNVGVLQDSLDGHSREALVSLDILGTDERQVRGWVQKVLEVLLNGYTPELNYAAIPPGATGLQVMWDGRDIAFKAVIGGPYLHVNATFPISRAY
jgi:hypothetical protein